ncbi:MAG: RdgB/HAM1 family non-canonical purine NTP pyrophosphatase [Blastocatellia bacterium]
MNLKSQIRTLLIATSNPGKVIEIASLLQGLNCRVIGFGDLPEAPPTVEETGTTFAENALLKAEQYHALTGPLTCVLTLADDSGLEVDALEGRPGVYSARYGGKGLTSAQQIELLLNEMEDVPDDRRTARFVCSIAMVGTIVGMEAKKTFTQTFEGRCEGVIARQPRGNGGFGYDPVFIEVGTGCTFAELTREEKATRSHRGKALRQAREFLMEWL